MAPTLSSQIQLCSSIQCQEAGNGLIERNESSKRVVVALKKRVPPTPISAKPLRFQFWPWVKRQSAKKSCRLEAPKAVYAQVTFQPDISFLSFLLGCAGAGKPIESVGQCIFRSQREAMRLPLVLSYLAVVIQSVISFSLPPFTSLHPSVATNGNLTRFVPQRNS